MIWEWHTEATPFYINDMKPRFNIIIPLICMVTFMHDSFAFGRKDRPADYAGERVRFKALIHYTEYAEEAHVQFARQTIAFFRKLTVGNGFEVDVTTSLESYTLEDLQKYNVLISADTTPQGPKERQLFEDYMESGGGWIGFHAAAYNDRHTGWPWFLEFIGGGVFKCNNWPPQPVLAEVEKRRHPVTRNLPKEFVIPASEYYQWTPEPRADKDIEVLLSLSPRNYPLGLKDIVYGGDWPLVWTNRNYRMIYLNMGHGDEEYIDACQQLLFINALRWIVSKDPKGNPFND